MATKKTTLDQVVETVEKVEETPVQQDKSAPAQEEYTLLDSKFLGDSPIYVAEVVENIPAAVGGFFGWVTRQIVDGFNEQYKK